VRKERRQERRLPGAPMLPSQGPWRIRRLQLQLQSNSLSLNAPSLKSFQLTACRDSGLSQRLSTFVRLCPRWVRALYPLKGQSDTRWPDHRLYGSFELKCPYSRPSGNYSTQGRYRIPDRTEAEEQKTLRGLLARSRILGVGRSEPGTPTSARLVPPRPEPNRLHLRDASAPYSCKNCVEVR